MDPSSFTISGAHRKLLEAHGLACCWEGPCGAVRLLERPSWFTAVPASSTVHTAASAMLAATPLPAKLHIHNPASNLQGTSKSVSVLSTLQPRQWLAK